MTATVIAQLKNTLVELQAEVVHWSNVVLQARHQMELTASRRDIAIGRMRGIEETLAILDNGDRQQKDAMNAGVHPHNENVIEGRTHGDGENNAGQAVLMD